jgi:hypothetical protein
VAIPLLIGGLVVALTSVEVPPQSPSESTACSLLTSKDIETATGIKPEADTHPNQMSMPGTQETMQMCTWVVRPRQGQVVISTARLPPGATAKDYSKNNAGLDALRAQHWTEESKDFGSAWCSIMSPPAGTKDGVMLSSCVGGAKGTLLSVVFMSPNQKLTIDQTKSLLDKAAARLP